MISLDKVCAGYKNRSVLKSISVDMKSGRLTGIVGPNGCGKTTLLKTIMGILPMSSGKITVCGRDQRIMSARERATYMSYLSQSMVTPCMTVGDLVLHGRFAHHSYPFRYSDDDRIIADSVMKKMEIEHLASHSLSTLSGGTKQKAYIAMALCSNSPFILLDEPTTYLDINHKKSLMELLSHLADEGKGVIAVMHDVNLAMQYCHEIIVMQNGVMVEKNTPEQLAKMGVFNDVFGVEIKAFYDGERIIYYT